MDNFKLWLENLEEQEKLVQRALMRLSMTGFDVLNMNFSDLVREISKFDWLPFDLDKNRFAGMIVSMAKNDGQLPKWQEASYF